MRQPTDKTPNTDDIWRLWFCVALGLAAYFVLRYFDWFTGHDVRSSYWFLP